MCCLFGILDPRHSLNNKNRSILLTALSHACELRGIDATGIAYTNGTGNLNIYKRPLPAHKMLFRLPHDTWYIMGHTRMATQGSELQNRNNHPFSGKVGRTDFALAHNGVLTNDKILRMGCDLPKTNIETDSYVAVQLLERYKTLNHDSIRYMAETVRGSFTFSILDELGNCTFVRGENPLCIYYFPKTGMYVYASTEAILKQGLADARLSLGRNDIVTIMEGDILTISNTGKREYSTFTVQPRPIRFCYDDFYPYYSDNSDYILDLKSVCGYYGLSAQLVDELLHEGMTPEEIEDYMYSNEF